ncbi:MAG TPA: hypothetical protein VH593_04090 [Ktedonobacteraceae bacterium]
MIVRILGENQFRLDESHMQPIAALDNRLLEAVHEDDHQAFSGLLQQLVQYVREYGQQIPDEEVIASNLIIPAPDMSLHEAKRYLENAVS